MRDTKLLQINIDVIIKVFEEGDLVMVLFRRERFP